MNCLTCLAWFIRSWYGSFLYVYIYHPAERGQPLDLDMDQGLYYPMISYVMNHPGCPKIHGHGGSDQDSRISLGNFRIQLLNHIRGTARM